MQIRIAVFLLLVVFSVAPLVAQNEESVDSNDTVVTTSTTTTSVTTTMTPQRTPPPWIHLVRMAAVSGPILFLFFAWVIGAAVHYRLVRREQARFPAVRGSRKPQTTPLILSAALFFVPFVLFVLFEFRSRQEIRLGISGVVDEWLPVTSQAWTTFGVCLALALIPWLFARRADTVS